MKKITIISLCVLLIILMTDCSQKEEETYSQKTETNFVELGYESPTNYKELSFDEDVREVKHEIKEGLGYTKQEAKDIQHEVKNSK